jgi:flagellar hook protein FlgE
MTISSSLNAGVTGLASNASRLATISDNIANSSTVGYKLARSDFSSIVNSRGSGTYSAGGVQVTTARVIDQPGALRSTNNATDLAVRGRGFLPVTQEASLDRQSSSLSVDLATTGSFRADKDGFLRSESGLVLMGWPANPDGTIPNFPRDTFDGLEPVRVNVNQSSGEPTTNMSLGINFPATFTSYQADSSGNQVVPDPITLPIEYFDNLGTSQDLTLTFTPTVPASAADPATNTWTLTLADSANAGTTVAEYTVVFDDSRDTGGTIESITTVSSDRNAVAPGEGDYDPATGLLVVEVAGGPITLDVGSVASGSGFTQFSDSFAPTQISKDGNPVGNLIGIDVDEAGFVRANFDTGIIRTAYQIPLIDMPNPNGLIPKDNQTYGISNASGSVFLWDAGDGATGDIVDFTLEESATDVAGELTSLIQTQRAYSSNAKVIQTVDEMLQETTNIKR